MAQPARYHTTGHTNATHRVSRWAAYLYDQRVQASDQLRNATPPTRCLYAACAGQPRQRRRGAPAAQAGRRPGP